MFHYLCKEKWYDKLFVQTHTQWRWLIFCEEHISEHIFNDHPLYTPPPYTFILDTGCSGLTQVWTFCVCVCVLSQLIKMAKWFSAQRALQMILEERTIWWWCRGRGRGFMWRSHFWEFWVWQWLWKRGWDWASARYKEKTSHRTSRSAGKKTSSTCIHECDLTNVNGQILTIYAVYIACNWDEVNVCWVF